MTSAGDSCFSAGGVVECNKTGKRFPGAPLCRGNGCVSHGGASPGETMQPLMLREEVLGASHTPPPPHTSSLNDLISSPPWLCARLCKVSVTLSPNTPGSAVAFGATLRFLPTQSAVWRGTVEYAGEQTICSRHDSACRSFGELCPARRLRSCSCLHAAKKLHRRSADPILVVQKNFSSFSGCRGAVAKAPLRNSPRRRYI